MPSYTNFYETVQEAQMRLDQTVVMYDGLPYFILCITDHKGDGVFRAYLDPLSNAGELYSRINQVPYTWHDELDMTRGQKMDNWLESGEGKKSPVIRKMLNSPKFNKFRPFPLGMANNGGSAIYLERTPARHTQQGLTSQMISYRYLDTGTGKQPVSKPNIYGPAMYRTIMGEYPSVDETLTNLTDKDVINISVAFHREFALIRGPVGIMFLSYKDDIVGYLPYGNLSEIKIASDFSYVKEVVDNLGMFNKIS